MVGEVQKKLRKLDLSAIKKTRQEKFDERAKASLSNRTAVQGMGGRLSAFGGERTAEREQNWKQEYDKKFLEDRTRQNMVRGNLGANAGAIGREAGKLADKETRDKFRGVLGKNDKKFKTTERSEGAWTLALVVAIAKDLLDIATVEALSGADWIIDLIFGAILFILLGTGVRKPARFLKSIGPAVLEAIPILGFLPTWSITVAYLKFKSQQNE
ncbi:hypothetical protein GYA54_00625 [Candidatus Kuenenbacteria bacterium]|nr:hypothetical protein [Candidatus Kuenenbacteria bacterium]